ncbi:MAG: Gfo/Idh/MocA family oxidoreductase [Anaerolineales bacterium]|nr:Gfo/Idh/MocA family oxidoreductase [Anaerolineales bacterium]
MRIAVIGCGSIGCRHLRNLHSLGYQDLLAFDPTEAARDYVKRELGVISLATLDEVWAQYPEVLLITAPTNLHAQLIQAAIQHQCHLFIEKPLSHGLNNLAELWTEIKEHGLISMVACNMRFHPGPATVKQLIEEETVGRVIAGRIQTGSYLPRWRPHQDYRQSYSASTEWGGAILDCIHEIDLALWYFGPAQVLAAAKTSASTIGLETDGLAEIILRHEAGILSNVHLNYVQHDYRRTCQVIGSEGTIYWDFNERRVQVYGPTGELIQTWPEPEGWLVNQMYLDELDHFLRAVQTGTPTVNPVGNGITTLKVALAARQMELG